MRLWDQYHTVRSLDEAVELLAAAPGRARIVAGATDIILELEAGLRPDVATLIDITRVPEIDHIRQDEAGWIHLGPMVTHNHCATSPLIRERAFALARACWEVGSPQIRNRGTIAGNLITASPANDSLTPLMALGAQVTLASTRGERVVPLREFYTGVRRTVMADDELMTDIAFPLPPETARSHFIKVGLRRAQAISVVHVATALDFDGDTVASAAITLGSVAPTIIHAPEAERSIEGGPLTNESIDRAAELSAQSASPIDDLRGSAAYRTYMVRVAVTRALTAIAQKAERADTPSRPVTLWGSEEWHWSAAPDAPIVHDASSPIETKVNGRPLTLTGGQDKTLLRLLREDGGLIGTKEGCAEGECGACTVILDGMAVMSCMVPAPRAHGAEILTVEGLSSNGDLHPVQRGFVERGAVQCGYCTPGFLMSGAALLAERPQPSVEEIKEAITGNLCRCTGYYSIVEAIAEAARNPRDTA